MSDTNAVESPDLLQNFKSVSDVRSRLTILGLTLLCLFLPIANSSVFGMDQSFSLDDEVLLGSWAHWFTLLAVTSLVAPAFEPTKSFTRVLDGLLGIGALLAGIVVSLTFVRAFSEIAMASAASRTFTSQRFDSSDYVSFSPSFGLAVFIFVVALAIIRAFKALKSKPADIAA